MSGLTGPGHPSFAPTLSIKGKLVGTVMALQIYFSTWVLAGLNLAVCGRVSQPVPAFFHKMALAREER